MGNYSIGKEYPTIGHYVAAHKQDIAEMLGLNPEKVGNIWAKIDGKEDNLVNLFTKTAQDLDIYSKEGDKFTRTMTAGQKITSDMRNARVGLKTQKSTSEKVQARVENTQSLQAERTTELEEEHEAYFDTTGADVYKSSTKLPAPAAAQPLNLKAEKQRINRADELVSQAEQNTKKLPPEEKKQKLLGALNLYGENGYEEQRAKAYRFLAEAQKEQEQLNEALESYDKSLELNPENSRTLINKGSLLRELQERGEDATSFNAGDYYAMGKSYDYSYDLENNAEKYYRKALNLDKDNPKILSGLGLLLKRQGRHNEAGDLLRQSGNNYLKNGEYQRAINDYETAQSLNSNSYFQKKIEEAKAGLERLAALQVKDMPPEQRRKAAAQLQEAAKSRYKKKDYTKAQEYGLKALELYGNRGNLHERVKTLYGLAAVYKKGGDYANALAAYKTVREISPNSYLKEGGEGYIQDKIEELEEKLGQ